MYRFIYYKDYIELLSQEDLLVLKEDIIKDFKTNILSREQYEYLINRLNKKLKNDIIIYI